MTELEFLRTRPAGVSHIEALVIDHPDDQPPYIGLVIGFPSSMDPRVTVRYTFRVPPQLATEVGNQLEILSIPYL